MHLKSNFLSVTVEESTGGGEAYPLSNCMQPTARGSSALFPCTDWLVYAMSMATLAIFCGCAAAQHGAMNIADKKLAQHDYSGALAKLNEAENYTQPSSNLQARISYTRGVCYQALGWYADARGSFQFVTNRFPETEYAQLSKQRLADLPRSEAFEFVATLETGSPLENYDSSAMGSVRKKWWNEVEKNGIKVKKAQVVKVTFKLFADGHIADVKITDPDPAKRNLEELATKAISDSAPFPQWSPEVQRAIKEPRPISITFTYRR
jgi:hypothetical protein